MRTGIELEQLGKDMAKDFISSSESSLTESLAKCAATHQLNRQQLNRVAESANVETYLSLIDNTDDKYIEFDLADPKIAFDNTSQKEKEASLFDDYHTPPMEVEIESVFDLYRSMSNMEEQEKVSEVKQTESEARRKAQELEGTLTFIRNHLDEAAAEGETIFSRLEYFTKQAVLEGEPFKNLQHVLSSMAAGLDEPLSKILKEKFTASIPHVDLEKESTFFGIPNPESDYAKLATKMRSTVERYGKLMEALEGYELEYDTLTKEAHIPKLYKCATIGGAIKETAGAAGGLVSGLFQFIRKHPKLAALLVAVPAVYASGKKRGRSEKGQILQESLIKFGPNRDLKKIFR